TSTEGGIATATLTGHSTGKPSGIVAQPSEDALTAWLERGEGIAALASPRPNPAGSTGLVLFSYAMRKMGNVSLTLYDVEGRLVQSVLSGVNSKKGLHQTRADLKALPVGTYTYRFSVGEENISGKIAR